MRRDQRVYRAESLLREVLVQERRAVAPEEATDLAERLWLRAMESKELGRGQRSVRICAWEQVTLATVEWNVEKGKLAGWIDDRHFRDSAPVELDVESALKIAAEKVVVPSSAKLVEARLDASSPTRSVFHLRWHHYYKKLWVEGDFIHVLINPTTRRLISLTRKWRKMGKRKTNR